PKSKIQNPKSNVPFRLQQLGYKQHAARRASYQVVAQEGELVIKQWTGAEATHYGRHTVLGVAVEAGLGSVGFAAHDNGSAGRAWQAHLLGNCPPRLPALYDVARVGHFAQLDGYHLHVAVGCGHTSALRAQFQAAGKVEA